VIVSLINPEQNGHFTVTFYCNASGKSVDVSATILSRPLYLLVLEPVDKGVIIAGNTRFGELKCIKVLLQNTGPQELVLDYVRLFRNIEFSIPQAQLPIIIPAGERKELKLCYLPSALGEQYDTLLLNDLCDTLTIPVEATADTSYYRGNSKCIVPVKGKTRGSWKNVFIGNPYPNPGNTIVNIEILTETEFDGSIECKLLDNIGNIISSSAHINRSNVFVDGVLYFNYKVSFDIDKFASGMYFIQINAGGTKNVLPYLIFH
jgi:hypothetical protein